jgi:hypothetical protein
MNSEKSGDKKGKAVSQQNQNDHHRVRKSTVEIFNSVLNLKSHDYSEKNLVAS